MGVNKVVFGAVAIMDISDSTVTAETLAEGETAYRADGEKITGTAKMGGIDTSDATAEAGDILSGETAYVKGKKVTGTIATKTSSNLTASGATVTVPAGYYASQATKSVATVTQATPLVNIDSAGKITSSVTQSAGYVSAGTKTATKQLTTKAAATYTPKTSNQTIASGTYLTGTQTIKGDSNLVAGNIKSGVSIFGVTGNYAGSGGSGGGVETCTVYLPMTGNYEATVFENGAITYKRGSGDEVRNVVRNSIFCMNRSMTDLGCSGGSLVFTANSYTFILASGSILDIYFDDGPIEGEIPDPF